MTLFLQRAREFTRDIVGDLESDQDLPPTLLANTDRGVLCAALVTPNLDDGELHNLAAMLASLVTVSMAKEAAFVFTSYICDVSDSRREAVSIIHADDAMGDAHALCATLTRHEDWAPDLGVWEDVDSLSDSVAQFAQAMTLGVGAAADLPEDLREELSKITSAEELLSAAHAFIAAAAIAALIEEGENDA